MFIRIMIAQIDTPYYWNKACLDKDIYDCIYR